MSFVSRPAALALLSCCLVFGVLLGLTGLAKDPRTITAPPIANAVPAAQGLRGLEDMPPFQAPRTLTTAAAAGADGPLEQDADFSNQAEREEEEESLASVLWPELEDETGGLWGPDEEERLQLKLDVETEEDAALDAPVGLWGSNLVDSEEDAALDGAAGFWGSSLDEKEGLADALLNGNWDRLMELDLDESFSFSYEM